MRGFFFCLCGSFDSVCALSPAPALYGRFREPVVSGSGLDALQSGLHQHVLLYATPPLRRYP